LKGKIAVAEKVAEKAALPRPAVTQTVTQADRQHARRIEELRAALEETMRVVAKLTAFGFEATKVNPKQLEAAVQKAVEEVGRAIAAGADIRRKEFDAL